MTKGYPDYSPRSCVLLTTPERFGLFGPVLGEGIDVRFDPELTCPLDGMLKVAALSGGKTIVLDEAHFYSARDLQEGLDDYLDGPMSLRYPMRFIVVCSRRTAADPLLAHLAMYDGIYDLVFDAQGSEVSVQLARIIQKTNIRGDIQEIFSAVKKHKELNIAYETS